MGVSEYCDAGDRDHQRGESHASARSGERRSNIAYDASAQDHADRVRDHVFPGRVAGQRPLDHLAQKSRAGADQAGDRIEPHAR